MKALSIMYAVLFLMSMEAGQAQQIPVIIRCDDIGMCHAVNLAVKKVIDTGIPISASVMFACPWYQEAVEILRDHPAVSVGVHLTLNAEWKNYRWGPVAASVQSLADSNGYFFPSRSLFFANKPKTEEVERELRAQIGRAVRSGLRIDYLDYHMGTSVDTPELRHLVWSLAKEYGLGISRCFGESDIEGVYGASPERKGDTLAALMRGLKPGTPRLLVFHLGMETPEMDALVDLNSFGLLNMSRYRQAELNALIDPAFRKNAADMNVRFTTYRELIETTGLRNMKAPAGQDW